ncbi:MAG: HAD family phosphatase [Lachnospiraceae bacterium]|jgi:HAD superfamily hydrolase (TIGR01509 family)|nr:HAD family phosphatase [Lachnospiraceae bacterium]
MIEAVIFDLDGSMVDSMWIWRSIDIEYLGKFGITLPDNLQACIEGMSFSETAAYFKERFDLPDDLETIKADWNRMAKDKYAHEVPVKEGVKELLAYCKEHGIKAGIATSNSRELVESVVRAHQMESCFGCIMTACEVEKGKPAPDIYLAVAEKLAVKPENCLVFEDIIPGIQAGKAAGMQVCAVYDKYSEYQDMEKHMLADYYTYRFRELIEEGVLA